MEQRKSVFFFIPTLDAGGAERVCLHYVNNLLTLYPILVLQFQRGQLFQEVKPEVAVLTLNTSTPEQLYRRWPKGLHLFYHGYMLLKQAHQLSILAQQHNCPAIISSITMANIIAVFAKIFFNRRLKVIINVHDVTSRIIQHSELSFYERSLLCWLIRIFYPKADLVVAVAHGIKKDLVEHFWVPEDKVSVLHNPIDITGLKRRVAEPVFCSWCTRKDRPLVIAVGRLVKLKGFDILVQAFAQLPDTMNARLMIIGEGEEHSALQQLIEQMELQKRVKLLGFQENPWKYMRYADLFVLSSRTEGLPNVLGEAMALGIPVLATDCSAGVREYLQEGQAGWLVPPGDPQALAQGIMHLLSNEQLRLQLAEQGRQRVTQFELSTSVSFYEALLKHLLAS